MAWRRWAPPHNPQQKQFNQSTKMNWFDLFFFWFMAGSASFHSINLPFFFLSALSSSAEPMALSALNPPKKKEEKRKIDWFHSSPTTKQFHQTRHDFGPAFDWICVVGWAGCAAAGNETIHKRNFISLFIHSFPWGRKRLHFSSFLHFAHSQRARMKRKEEKWVASGIKLISFHQIAQFFHNLFSFN